MKTIFSKMMIQAVGADGRPDNHEPCIDQEDFLQ